MLHQTTLFISQLIIPGDLALVSPQLATPPMCGSHSSRKFVSELYEMHIVDSKSARSRHYRHVFLNRDEADSSHEPTTWSLGTTTALDYAS